MRVRNNLPEGDLYLQSKTMLQWRKEKRAPNTEAKGEYMYHNRFRQNGGVYWLFEDTHDATQEELEQWRLERQAERLRKKEIALQKEAARTEREAFQAEQEAQMLERNKARQLEYMERNKALNEMWLAMDRSRILCVDVETTGLCSDEDEILQISIIDGAGKVLFNEYIKPKNILEWEEAEAINGISPQMVADKPNIDEYIPRLNEIFAGADLIVGYNIVGFDRFFLRAAGIDVPELEMPYDAFGLLPISEIKFFDVMLEFAPVYGEWNEYFKDYTWQKLSVCAEYYCYENNEKYHDSLEDVRATLHCFWAMLEEKRKSMRDF